MTTQPAPLLTATMATDCVPGDNLNADAYYARRVALQALATGRTACVDAIELKRLQRIDHDFPQISAFYMKHAVGQMLAPSCFCCGQPSDERAVTHAELPDVFVCRSCKDATACVRVMSEDEQCTVFYEFIDDWMRVNKTYPSGIDCWLACARANGLVKP